MRSLVRLLRGRRHEYDEYDDRPRERPGILSANLRFRKLLAAAVLVGAGAEMARGPDKSIILRIASALTWNTIDEGQRAVSDTAREVMGSDAVEGLTEAGSTDSSAVAPGTPREPSYFSTTTSGTTSALATQEPDAYTTTRFVVGPDRSGEVEGITIDVHTGIITIANAATQFDQVRVSFDGQTAVVCQEDGTHAFLNLAEADEQTGDLTIPSAASIASGKSPIFHQGVGFPGKTTTLVGSGLSD